MILLLFAALLGGGATVALLWPLGPLVALMTAPLGASLLALWTAAFIAHRRDRDHSVPICSAPSVPAEVL